MKKNYLFIILVVIVSLNFEAVAQLKSISQLKPVVDTTLIVTTTDDVDMQKDGVGTWTKKETEGPYTILEGNDAPYDSDYGNYVVDLTGSRRADGDDNYCSSLMLWAPEDSGIPWNYLNSKVKFDIKILDSEDYSYGNNSPERALALYFWVAIKHGWDSEPQPKYVRLYLDSPVGPLQEGTEGGGDNAWSNIFSTGLGTGLNDGAWHTFEIDLIDIIEAKKQAAIDGGKVDPNLGDDPSEGVKWNWYGVLGLEFYTLHARVGNVTVVGAGATAIEDKSFDNPVSVYPNPSSGVVNIDLGNISNTVSVDVYNITGQLLKTVNNITSNTSIDLSDLAQGHYFVKVNNGVSSITKKVVILH